MSVLITGGAGYIGSHIALHLVDAGRQVAIVDNLSTGLRTNVPAGVPLFEGSIGDQDLMARAIESIGATSIIHCAGSTEVNESVRDPLKYYENNVANSIRLFQQALRSSVQTILFSSSAAVYGEPEVRAVDENHPLRPISPYGTSKLMTEQILRDLAGAAGVRYANLRYFNVAGADPLTRLGQSTPNATHLIKVACRAACGLSDGMEIFGDDYPTSDGSAIRDFIHVADLADVHVRIADYLNAGGHSGEINCGYGSGYSVKEVVSTVQRLSGHDFPVTVGPRREGDIVEIISDCAKLHSVIEWQPKYNSLETMVSDALKHEQSLTETSA